MTTYITPLTIATIVGSGIVAGLFFIFSFSVMSALALMPKKDGMLVMQHINNTILNPAFFTAFLGTAVACVVLAVYAIWQQPPNAGWLLAGSLAYLIGAFGVTMVGNVPLNLKLDTLDATSQQGQAFWVTYQTRWLLWNHLRTVISTASTALLAYGLVS